MVRKYANLVCNVGMTYCSTGCINPHILFKQQHYADGIYLYKKMQQPFFVRAY